MLEERRRAAVVGGGRRSGHLVPRALHSVPVLAEGIPRVVEEHVLEKGGRLHRQPMIHLLPGDPARIAVYMERAPVGADRGGRLRCVRLASALGSR